MDDGAAPDWAQVPDLKPGRLVMHRASMELGIVLESPRSPRGVGEATGLYALVSWGFDRSKTANIMPCELRVLAMGEEVISTRGSGGSASGASAGTGFRVRPPGPSGL